MVIRACPIRIMMYRFIEQRRNVSGIQLRKLSGSLQMNEGPLFFVVEGLFV